MDRHGARIPIESDQEFDRWFWDHRSMERPGDTRSQRPSALQAEAPAESSPGHSIDRASELTESGSLAEVGVLFDSAPRPYQEARSIDWEAPPPPIPLNIAWYRRRAGECGDLAAEMMEEGVEGTAYGAAYRAGHFGRIVQALDAERRADWRLPNHPGNFL